MRGDGEYDGGSEGRWLAKRRRGLGRHKSFVRNLNRYYQEAFGRRKWDRTNYVLHETWSADHNLSVASSLMNGEKEMKLRSRIRRYERLNGRVTD